MNDQLRDYRGRSEIHGWAERDIVGGRLRMEVVGCIEHYGDPIVTAHVDGAFDKRGLPDPLVLVSPFSARGDRIVRLIILRNLAGVDCCEFTAPSTVELAARRMRADPLDVATRRKRRSNTMVRNALFASLIALGVAAGAAQAQAPDTTGLVPGGGNIIGGGLGATLVGGGDNSVILYNQPGAGGGGAGWSQAGRTARFGGTHGDGPQVEYVGPAPAGVGREAWLSGGGDNAEVVYGRRR